jgi:hypothetical protein
MPVGPQMVTFEIEDESISVSSRNAARIVEKLRQDPVRAAVADKIERATQLHEDTRVKLAIGEDEIVLDVVGELRATGDFHSSSIVLSAPSERR